jgi:hypothetical protein
MTDQKMAENGALKVFDDFWNWRMSSTPEFATMVSYDWVVDYTYIHYIILCANYRSFFYHRIVKF